MLLHRPGPELAVTDPDAAQLLEPVDPERAAAEHDALAKAYGAEGILVRFVEPAIDGPEAVPHVPEDPEPRRSVRPVHGLRRDTHPKRRRLPDRAGWWPAGSNPRQGSNLAPTSDRA